MFIKSEPDTSETLCNGQCFVDPDSSDPQHQGSFAWIMSNSSGERLVRCSGPVFGHAISLYRAESYGTLSYLCVLHGMSQLHQKPDKQLRPLLENKVEVFETCTHPGDQIVAFGAQVEARMIPVAIGILVVK